MKDVQIRDARHHPDLEPFMVFNDKPKCTGTLIFESFLQKDPVSVRLAQLNPTGYYGTLMANDKQEINNRIIKVKKGGFARLPHACFLVWTSDNSPCTYSMRALKDM